MCTEHLGRYELLGELGRGGMARVLLAAADDEDGRRRLFAIKQPYATTSDGFVRALYRESNMSLRHANVVRVEEVFGSPEAPYGVMPYVEGCTLNKLLGSARRRGVRLPVGVVARIALDTLEGLAALHDLVGPDGRRVGAVHRDVKPENVLVGTDGVTRLIDFGLAGPAELLLPCTRAGTLAYMAPEQVRGLEVDARTDVFAMGIVLWESLAGRRLFGGANDAETMHRVQWGDIAVLDMMGQEAVALARVCMAALQRDPSRRYANARELANAVLTAVRGHVAEPGAVAPWVVQPTREGLAGTFALAEESLATAYDDPTATTDTCVASNTPTWVPGVSVPMGA